MVFIRPITFTPAATTPITRYLPANATLRPISYAAPSPIATDRRPGLTQPEIAEQGQLTQQVIAQRAQETVNRYPSAPFRTYEVSGGYWYGVSTVDGMESRTRLNVATSATSPDPNARYRTSGGTPTYSEGSAGWSRVSPSARPTQPGPGSTKAQIFAYSESVASWEREQLWSSIPESATWNDINDWYGDAKFNLPTQERRQWEIGQSLLPSLPSSKALAIEQQYAAQKGMIVSSSGNLTPTEGGYRYSSGELFTPTALQPKDEGSILPALPSLSLGKALPAPPVGLIGGIARAKLGQDYLTGGSIIPQAKATEKFNIGSILGAPATTATGTGTTAGAPLWGFKPDVQRYVAYPVFAGTMMSLGAMGGFFEGIKGGIDTTAAKIPYVGAGVSAAGHFGVGFARIFPEGFMSSALVIPAAEFAVRQPAVFASSIIPGSAAMVSAGIEHVKADPFESAGAIAGLIVGPKLIGKGYTAVKSRAVEFNIWRQVPAEHRPTIRATSTIGRYIKGIESPVQREPVLGDVINIREGIAGNIRGVLSEEPHSLFGTVTTYGQMERPYRLTKDIDVIAANPRKMQTRLFEAVGAGYKKAGTGIDIEIGGRKTAHALDIHAPPPEYPIKPVKSLRVVYDEPVASYPFDYTPERLLKTGPLTQEHLYTQAQRKATATIGAPEKGGGWRFGPEGHRMKDVYDLVETASYLTAEEKARTSPLMNPIRRYKVWRLERALGVIREDPMVSGVLEEFSVGKLTSQGKTSTGLRFDVGEPPTPRSGYASQARQYGQKMARRSIADFEAHGEEFTVRISPSPTVKKGLGPLLETLTRRTPGAYIPKIKPSAGIDTYLPGYRTSTGKAPVPAYALLDAVTEDTGASAFGLIKQSTDISYLTGGRKGKGYDYPIGGKQKGYTFPTKTTGYTPSGSKTVYDLITGGKEGKYSLTGKEKRYSYEIPTRTESYKYPGRSYEYPFTSQQKTSKYSPPPFSTTKGTTTRTHRGQTFGGMHRHIPFKTTGWFTVPLTRKRTLLFEEEDKHKKKLRLHFDVRGSKWIIKNPIPRPEVVLGGESGKQYKNELKIYDKQYSKKGYTVHMPFDIITDYKVTKGLRF